MKGSTALGLVIGAAVGVAAGMLLAPRSGAQTRALLVDQVDEMWGQGQDFYEKNVKDLGNRATSIAPAAVAKSDELREKIEIARERIATQIANNAAENFNAAEVAEDVAEAIEDAAEKVAEAVEDLTAGISEAAPAEA